MEDIMEIIIAIAISVVALTFSSIAIIMAFSNKTDIIKNSETIEREVKYINRNVSRLMELSIDTRQELNKSLGKDVQDKIGNAYYYCDRGYYHG
jgi:hypothetical protein